MQVTSSHLNSTTIQRPAELSRERSKVESESQDLQKQNRANNTDQAEDEVSQQRELQKLKNIDRQVRAHELAHVSVGGRYVTSGASFNYERGPDGRQYAVSGEVSIDTSAVPGDPAATLQKAQVVRRAALAPADPSAQDRRVAAQAISVMQQARLELSLQNESEQESTVGSQLDTFA